jgi:hypothetical protein
MRYLEVEIAASKDRVGAAGILDNSEKRRTRDFGHWRDGRHIEVGREHDGDLRRSRIEKVLSMRNGIDRVPWAAATGKEGSGQSGAGDDSCLDGGMPGYLWSTDIESFGASRDTDGCFDHASLSIGKFGHASQPSVKG